MVPDDYNEVQKLKKDYKPNRAERRRKPVNNPWYTKATHKFKKIRNKNAPTAQQRKRRLAEARKARKEDYSEVS